MLLEPAGRCGRAGHRGRSEALSDTNDHGVDARGVVADNHKPVLCASQPPPPARAPRARAAGAVITAAGAAYGTGGNPPDEPPGPLVGSPAADRYITARARRTLPVTIGSSRAGSTAVQDSAVPEPGP